MAHDWRFQLHAPSLRSILMASSLSPGCATGHPGNLRGRDLLPSSCRSLGAVPEPRGAGMHSRPRLRFPLPFLLAVGHLGQTPVSSVECRPQLADGTWMGTPRRAVTAVRAQELSGAPWAAPLSAKLEGLTVLQPGDGTAVPLLGLWEHRRAVVAWVRHFGCLLCKKRAALLMAHKSTFDAHSVVLVIIGPGSVDQATQFAVQTDFTGEIYTDPQFHSFLALSFAYGPLTVLNPQAAKNVIEARLEGFTQDWGLSLQRETVLKGGWQQGGILVAGPGADTVHYLHRDKTAGDEPDMVAVLDACCPGVEAGAAI